jgi:hypothetical protein
MKTKRQAFPARDRASSPSPRRSAGHVRLETNSAGPSEDELLRDVFEGSRPSGYVVRHPELTYFLECQGFDHLAEVPRDRAAYVLEEYAKVRKPPPQWAAERFGRLSSPGGRPRTNVLVNLIRAYAVEKCSVHRQRGSRYERAAKLLHEIPAELFSGLEVAADAETLRKSCRNVLSLDRKSDEACLRHYFPLLIEGIESRA